MKRHIRWREMRKKLCESLGINQTTNLSQYGQCPKEAIQEHYEQYQQLTSVSIVMFSGTNGGKGEREQYFERVTVVSLHHV